MNKPKKHQKERVRSPAGAKKNSLGMGLRQGVSVGGKKNEEGRKKNLDKTSIV